MHFQYKTNITHFKIENFAAQLNVNYAHYLCA